MPDGDLFKRLADGSASIVTDHIRTFTPRGVALKSGRELEADIIVTATGLNLQLFAGMTMTIDGEAVDVPCKVAFKGMMLDGLPNFASRSATPNCPGPSKSACCASTCRLVAHLDQHGHAYCYPQLPSSDMPTRPLLYPFGAGYVQRALPMLPRQGLGAPWLMSMNYLEDAKVLRQGPVLDPNLKFAAAGTRITPVSDGTRQAATA